MSSASHHIVPPTLCAHIPPSLCSQVAHLLPALASYHAALHTNLLDLFERFDWDGVCPSQGCLYPIQDIKASHHNGTRFQHWKGGILTVLSQSPCNQGHHHNVDGALQIHLKLVGCTEV